MSGSTLLSTYNVPATAAPQPPPRQSAFWSHVEAACYIGIPPATLYGMNYKGTGPRFYKVGRHCKYRPADVEAWLEERASTPRPVA